MSKANLFVISRRLASTRTRQKPVKSGEMASSRLYGWGLSATGALGIPELLQPSNPSDIPQRLTKKPRLLVVLQDLFYKKLEFSRHKTFVSAACGHGFTLFLAKSGTRQIPANVFGAGLNTMGQLGYQLGAEGGRNSQWVWHAAPITLGPSTSKVIACAAGRAHSVFVTDDNVYALGNNGFGQCGRPVIEQEDYSEPSRMADDNQPLSVDQQLEADERIVSVSCGLDTTYLLSSRGRLYACGCGTDGQLGNGEAASTSVVQRIGGGLESERVVSLSCAADTAMALTAAGRLYAWGNNEYSQILPTASPSVAQPEQLAILPAHSNERIVSAAAGGSCCCVVTSEGRVLVWGFGALGLGPARLDTEGQIAELPANLFASRPGGSGGKVQHVEAGLMHFAALTTNGELYVWGKNRYGVLGLDNEDDQHYPLKVNGIHGRVRQLSLGPDHTVALSGPM